MTEQDEVKQTFGYIQDLAQEALGEMRALIWQLRPLGLENGVVSALRSYAEMLGLSIETNITGAASIPGTVEEALWRIGQEALANCKKHSQTTETSLTFSTSKDKIVMSIRDRGCGFHYRENLEIPSLGLKSMKTRTEASNGQFHLKSKPGIGTEIEIHIPY
jgi:two-component system, NarL family, sensor kinase